MSFSHGIVRVIKRFRIYIEKSMTGVSTCSLAQAVLIFQIEKGKSNGAVAEQGCL